MKKLILSVIVINLAAGAASAFEPGPASAYTVCRRTEEAKIDRTCVNAANVVLNGDEKAAKVACADSAPGCDIQQCIESAKTILSESISAREKSHIAAVACSGGTAAGAVQQCLLSAETVLDSGKESTGADTAMAAAIACSGNTNRGLVQQCIRRAQVVASGPAGNADLTAAFACSGNTDIASVQSCINGRNFEIGERSRFQLILELLGAANGQ